MKTYAIVENGKAIYCVWCGLTSHNPNDVEQKYCGKCHKFHEFREPPICPHCDEPIAPGERAPNMSVPWHRECLFRGCGGIAHQMRECCCFGGTRADLDIEGMTPRQSAECALIYYLAHHLPDLT